MASQHSNQIDWCIGKAQKELEECKRQKKKPRHRGLVKTEPNKSLALRHISKAEHYLKGLQLLKSSGVSDLAVGMGFYSLYHCFLAIASKFGYESGNQTCTIALIELLQEEGKIKINQEIVDLMKYEEEQNVIDNSFIELREDYTYGIDLMVKSEELLNRMEKHCIDFISVVKEIVYA